MNLDQYYHAKSKLKAPKDLDFLQERNWFKIAVEKLKEKLSFEDLKIVNDRQNEWQKKVNSSLN